MNTSVSELLSSADAQLSRQQYAKAIASYRQAVDIDPNNTSTLFRLGMALLKTADYESAGEYFRHAVNINRKFSDGHYGLGLVHQHLGHYQDAIRCLNKAIKLKPTNARYHLMLAGIYHDTGELKKSHEHLLRTTRLNPADAQPHCLLATSYEQMHKLDDASDSVNKALQVAPDYPHALLIKARLLRRNGNYDNAKDLLASLIQSNPDKQVLYRSYYELGRILDRQKKYNDAFSAFDKANRIQLSTAHSLQFDKQHLYRMIDEYAGITRDQFARWKHGTNFSDGLVPVFLVGFPRSGTTMTEQVLASHPAISTADEKPLLANTIQLACQYFPGKPVSEVLDSLSTTHIHNLRERYSASIKKLKSRPSHTMVVDKLPLNIMAIGIINRIFPDAKVIVALRDPRDVCLSCFMQEFEPNAGMINFNTLDDTVRFYKKVMSLWLHQRDMVTVDFLEVRYEDTTVNLEAQARRLLDFLNLPWNDSVLEFYKQQHFRAVTTPSYEAISQPVHRNAVARWKHYQRQMSPVLDELASLISAFGYTT